MTAIILIVLVLLLPAGVSAQSTQPPSTPDGHSTQPAPHTMSMPMPAAAPLGLSEARDASGTSWQPDDSPMYGSHLTLGAWTLMLHENIFVQAIDDGSTRGHRQVGSVNWGMAMLSRSAAGGRFSTRAMLSLEPLTVGTCGYPDLLASGEACHGEGLHDQQHPHDLFMELAARYQHALGDRIAYDLYGGPVGDPALGPTAFPHRLSALPNLLAPISHHWLDATHVSFGVVTAGVYGRTWKAEGSIFNGREPDEYRYDFDFGSLSSYSGRLWVLPSARWALQVSAGHLADAEPHGENGLPVTVNRFTASAAYQRPLQSGDVWATTIAWGQNREADASATSAVLIETSTTLAVRHLVFGRAEFSQKSGADLDVPPLADRVLNLLKLQGGYAYELPQMGPFVPAIGGSVWVGRLPSDLIPFYGRPHPLGAAIFFSLRPPRMEPMMPMRHDDAYAARNDFRGR